MLHGLLLHVDGFPFLNNVRITSPTYPMLVEESLMYVNGVAVEVSGDINLCAQLLCPVDDMLMAGDVNIGGGDRMTPLDGNHLYEDGDLMARTNNVK